jgi:tetratricopeptide (TPR) repeat protein
MELRQLRVLVCAMAACVLLPLHGLPVAQTASAQSQPSFLRGLTALHNFEYEDANEAFVQARTIDPALVMAYWGEAMTYNQTLWRRENVQAAREALAQLGPTAAVRAARVTDPKEKALLGAVEILFGPGDAAARHQQYVGAMARIHTEFPDDPDVTAFYALALLGTMSRSLIGDTDAHDRALAGSDTQKHVAALLDSVLAAHPQHPGALHYLLHDYDDPEHARLALAAARSYAAIAAGSSHALHMPSHIFLQLGLWHDAARSDRAAYDVSSDRVQRKHLSPAMRNYHALSWLQYELLQLGRYREAWTLIDELKPVVSASGALTPGSAPGEHASLLSDLSSMRARFAIETRRWDLLAREQNFGNVNELFAIGVSAARSRNPDLAGRARRALADRVASEQEGDLRPAIGIMERELAALIALAAGRAGEAVAILEAATRTELQLPAPFGLPEPVKPAPELLGEVLLELGRARDAVEPFDQALRRNANRSLSVLGLARAFAALGRTEESKRRYRELLANFDRADDNLPELAEVRAALASSPTSGRFVKTMAWALGSAAVVVAAVLARWRMKSNRQGSRRIRSQQGTRKTQS